LTVFVTRLTGHRQRGQRMPSFTIGAGLAGSSLVMTSGSW
jgi:hypothetical protein